MLNTPVPSSSVSDKARQGHYVPALTGLRAIAAYLVFLHHYNPSWPDTLANRLFAQGYIGVSVFFVLSGFLIYHRYAEDYFDQTHWSWRTYWQNRFARIFPLYAFILMVTIGINTALGQPLSWVQLGLNVTLLKGLFEEYKFSGIAQSWSLTVEECFYGVAPLLFILLRHGGAFWLMIGLVGAGLLLWTTVGQLAWHGLFSNLPFVLFYTFFGRAFEFVVGMCLARRWHQYRLPTFQYTAPIGLLLISCCVLWQANVPMFIANPTSLLWSEVVVYNYMLPVGIGLFLTGLLQGNSVIRNVLTQPILQRLGRSSYAFYLIHIGIIASGLRKVGVASNWLLFGLLVAIAYGLYVVVEKPLQQKLRANPNTP